MVGNREPAFPEAESAHAENGEGIGGAGTYLATATEFPVSTGLRMKPFPLVLIILATQVAFAADGSQERARLDSAIDGYKACVRKEAGAMLRDPESPEEVVVKAAGRCSAASADLEAAAYDWIRAAYPDRDAKAVASASVKRVADRTLADLREQIALLRNAVTLIPGPMRVDTKITFRVDQSYLSPPDHLCTGLGLADSKSVLNRFGQIAGPDEVITVCLRQPGVAMVALGVPAPDGRGVCGYTVDADIELSNIAYRGRDEFVEADLGTVHRRDQVTAIVCKAP
jgi:hypothetical protein